jgi:hypothetical protein
VTGGATPPGGGAITPDEYGIPSAGGATGAPGTGESTASTGGETAAFHGGTASIQGGDKGPSIMPAGWTDGKGNDPGEVAAAVAVGVTFDAQSGEAGVFDLGESEVS